MDINVVMLDGRHFCVRVNPQDTVLSLKRQIQEKLHISPERQKLIFENNGQRIPLSDDSRTLSSYALQSGSKVSLLVTEPLTFQVFVRNEKGQISTYDVKPDETVSNFKAKVQERLQVPVSQQRLIFQGKEMREGKLSDYGVQQGSTIELVFRLRGGR